MPLHAFQRDATLRRMSATVLSCIPEDEHFRVVLDDTVLYPEGGGQPSDHGRIGNARVLHVRNEGDGIVAHLAHRPVALGPTEVEVDWARRHDHMQQHSAQHLLSALAEDLLGRRTEGFHLGAEVSDIELSGPPLDSEDLGRLQAEANARVREARPMRHRVVSPSQLEALKRAPEGKLLRSRGHKARGDIRLVEIQGLDLNTCGGTHVGNTAELQSIYLVRGERNKGGTRLFFLAGSRVFRALRGAQRREAEFTRLLRSGPTDHVERLQQVQEQQKVLSREIRTLSREMAELLGQELVRRSGDIHHLHRDGVDLRFLQSVAGTALLERPRMLLLLTAGGPLKGSFLLAGPEEQVRALGPKVAAALGGRGGGARGRFQGRAESLDGTERALEVLHGTWSPDTWDPESA